jgi:sugar transferase (PEP-CTERM system associated)
MVKHSFFSRNILIIGTGEKAKKIGDLLDYTESNYLLKGYIGASFEPIVVPSSKIIGDTDSILEKVKSEGIHTIVLALTERRGTLPVSKLLICKLMGIWVIDLPSFYEMLMGKLPVEELDPGWLLFCEGGFRISEMMKLIKRISDLILSITGLLLSSFLFPLIALLVKLSSPGPIFYRQLRVGEMQKEFFIYKFRTMKHNAEENTGVTWAQENDSRSTKIGRFLRKTRLDEIPQFYNILIGNMSFIGPRPERPVLVNKIKEVTSFYTERHFVKPGLTGWAQVKYPYGDSFGDAIEKLRYDLYYIKNMSPFLDILIIFETVKVILFRRGGR